MDIETRIIYINGGILLASGRKYVLEEKEILPVKISSQETEKGFKLIATVEDKEVQRFSFYINNELYKTNEVNSNISEIEVTDKAFGKYECLVKAYDKSRKRVFITGN